MLELVELADGHGGVAADRSLHDQPMTDPSHPQVVDRVDALAAQLAARTRPAAKKTAAKAPAKKAAAKRASRKTS